MLLLGVLVIGTRAMFAESSSRTDDVTVEYPVPLSIIAEWLNRGSTGLIRGEPRKELSDFVNGARSAKSTTPEMKRELDALFAPLAAAEQRMFDQATAVNDTTRSLQIRNMVWSNRLKTLLPRIELLAAHGDVVGNALLGFWYVAHDGPLPFDAEKAVKYIRAAADAGNPAACAEMGDIWSQTSNVTASERGTHMQHYYESALSKGSMAALTSIIPFYMSGGVGVKMENGQDRMFAVALGEIKPDFKRAYVLSRVLCLCQGIPGANELGTQYIQWITQEITPETQLQAENTVNDTFAHLCKAAPETFRAAGGDAAAREPVQAQQVTADPAQDWSDMTKAAWKKIAARTFDWTPLIPLSAQADRFQHLMGKPNQTQTVGNDVYWYYKCSDGTIKMKMDASVLQMGTVQAQVNDY